MRITEYGHLDSMDAATDGETFHDTLNGNGGCQLARSDAVSFTFTN